MAGVEKDLDYPADSSDKVEFTKKIENNQRKVLKVAAYFPAILGVAFLLIALFYKSKGGYKPVVLESSWE